MSANNKKTAIQHVVAEEDPTAWLGLYLRRLAHDLIGPARNIRGFAQLIERRVADSDDEKLKSHLTHLLNESTRQYDMLLAAQTFGRLGTLPLQKETLPLKDSCNRMWKGRIAEVYPEAKLHNKIDADFTIFADREQMDVVLFELLENACRFSGKGSIPEVTVTAGVAGSMHYLEVTDVGIGVAAEFYSEMPHLFRQLNPRMDYGGLGAGLAFVDTVLRRHNGHLEVKKNDSSKGGLSVRAVFPKL